MTTTTAPPKDAFATSLVSAAGRAAKRLAEQSADYRRRIGRAADAAEAGKPLPAVEADRLFELAAELNVPPGEVQVDIEACVRLRQQKRHALSRRAVVEADHLEIAEKSAELERLLAAVALTRGRLQEIELACGMFPMEVRQFLAEVAKHPRVFDIAFANLDL